MLDKYYVYAYLDPRKPYNDSRFTHEPFYIGRGCGSRINYHLNEARKLPDKIDRKLAAEKRLNVFKINKIRSIFSEGLEPILLKLVVGLSLEDSITLEEELIAELGRSVFGEGILTNLSKGGEGWSGRKASSFGRFNSFFGKHHTDETKAKISKVHKGKIITKEHKESISKKLKGKPKSRSTVESRRTYMRKLVNENPESPILQRLGESRAKEWFIEGPDGTVYKVVSLRKFCTDNGLNNKTLLTAKNKGRRTTTGWNIVEEVDDYIDLTKRDA